MLSPGRAGCPSRSKPGVVGTWIDSSMNARAWTSFLVDGSVRMPGAASCMVVRTGSEEPAEVSTEIESAVPGALAGHTNSILAGVAFRITASSPLITTRLWASTERKLPTSVAPEPGTHAATAEAPARFCSFRISGSSDPTLISTVLVVVRPAELAASKRTVWLPKSCPDGVHSKSPLAALKVAPAGRAEADRVSGELDPSLALTANATGEPAFATWAVGTTRTGASAGAVSTVVSVTASPELADKAMVSAEASAAAVTSNRARFWPARRWIAPGTLR